MVLQRDRTCRGNSRQLRILDHFLAIQIHIEPIALHDDDKAVPLAGRPIRFHLGRGPGPHFRRLVLVRSVAPHFSGTDRPTPNVR